MVISGVQERPAVEYKNLLKKAGFRKLLVVEISAPVSMTEVCLVP